MNKLKFVKINPKAELPKRAHASDAGLDCMATSRTFLDKFNQVLDENDLDEIKRAVKVKYGLGFACDVPFGYALKPHSKSSICKTGLVLSNGVGVGDAGYQGEYSVVFYILPFSIPYEVGDSICQLLVEKVEMPEPYWGKFDDVTERGTGGYGHSGNIFKK